MTSDHTQFPVTDAANLEPSILYDTQQHPSDPSIGESKKLPGNKADIKLNNKSGAHSCPPLLLTRHMPHNCLEYIIT